MHHSIGHGRPLILLAFLIAGGPITAPAQDTDSAVESFIEPFKTIQIPSVEVATITGIDVREGDKVVEGQVLARLDDRVLRASLAAARAAKDSQGNLRAAQAELEMKNRQLNILDDLRVRGNATQRERDRALADRELSAARLESVREELEIRKFEYERIQVQIDNRILRSPLDGVVAGIDKEAGEFVAPTDPIVMTIVQLDPVQAVFSLPISAAQKVVIGKPVQLSVGAENRRIQGIVDFVAPIADAESGTMRVKVRIDNPDGRILSGSTCRWQAGTVSADEVAKLPRPRLQTSQSAGQTKGLQ